MRTFTECAKTNMITEFFDVIDNEIICEKLKDKKLIDLASHLNKFSKQHKNGNNSFGSIFGYYNVAWDKITEKDWESFDLTTDKGMNAAKSAIRKIVGGRSNSIYGIALLYDKEDKISNLITPGGVVYTFYKFQWVSSYNKKEGDPDHEYRPDYENNLKQYEILEYLENKTKCLVLDLSAYGNNIQKKRSDRREAQAGIEYRDDNYNKKLAEQNVERYKKLITKHKAEKAAKEDTVCQDVQAILNKVMELSIQVAKDPITYADVSYDISRVLAACHDKRTWNSRTNNYEGSDGLLVLLSAYLSNQMSVIKNGGYSWERNTSNEKKKQIEEKIKKIEKMLVDIDAKI